MSVFEPLLSTDLSNGRLVFERVITDDSYSLASFSVFSACDVPLVVHMGCPDNSQVVFQLQNENLRAGEPEDDPDDWNQLFNEVCPQP